MQSLLAFQVFLFLVLSFCYCENETVQVVGSVECTDCTKNNIDISHTFAGLRVVISCKSSPDEITETRGISKLDKQGNFKVLLTAPEENCVAKVYNALGSKCLTQNRHEASKIIFNHNGKQFFGLTEKKLRFSSVRCDTKLLGRTFKQDAHIVYIPRPPPLPTFLNQPYPPPAPDSEPLVPSPTPPRPAPSMPPRPIEEPPEAAINKPSPLPIPTETLTPPPTSEPLPSQGSTFNGPSPPIPTETFTPPPPTEPLPSKGSTFNGPSSPPVPTETLTPPPASEPLPSKGSAFNGPSSPSVPTETLTPPPTSKPLPSKGSTFNGPSSSPPIPIEISPTSEPFPPHGPSSKEPSLPPFPLL